MIAFLERTMFQYFHVMLFASKIDFPMFFVMEVVITVQNGMTTTINAKSDGIKITNLYVLAQTDLQKMFEKGEYKPLEMEEYFSLLKKALKIIPKNVVIHRLTGDPPKKILIAPDWTRNKKLVLSRVNEILSDSQ